MPKLGLSGWVKQPPKTLLAIELFQFDCITIPILLATDVADAKVKKN